MDTQRFRKEDYLTVTEFARLVGISASRLREYDRKGLFSPIMRGDGRENKYRYYAPIQITTVKLIRVLTEIGVSLDTIKTLVDDRSPEKMIKLLTSSKRELEKGVSHLREMHLVIDIFLRLLGEGISVDENEIYVCEMPETPIVMGDPTCFRHDEGYMSEFLSFRAASHKPRLNLSYPIGGFFSSMQIFSCRPSEPTRFFSLDPDGLDAKEKGLYLIGYTRGSYGVVNDLPQRLESYAKENDIIFDGPVYNTYLFDEVSVANSNQYLLQVAASIKDVQRSLSPYIHRRLKVRP